jgi:hypothetical protein
MRIHALTLLTGLALAAACDPKDDDLDRDDVAVDPDDVADTDDADEEPETDGSDEAETGETPDPDPADTDAAPPADEPAEDAACDEVAASRACALEAPADGTQFCAPIGADGSLRWGACLELVECDPSGASDGDDCVGTCVLDGDVPVCADDGGGGEEEDTPLVLSFDGAPVRIEAVPAATFDIAGQGECISTDWPAAVTPWLAIDLDRSGSIEAGHELFGSGTRLASGTRAANGFEALSALDTNHDGQLSSADERFGDLVLWADHDADKLATLAELEPMAVRGILSIELGYAIDRRCDDRGNCEVERASFTFVDRGGAVRTGDVVDIHLPCQ